jgi:uncharacterized membrane protein
MGAPLPGAIPQVFPPQVGVFQPAILQQSWQGPYPPPEAVERYEKAMPGFFNRIVSMAERMEAAQIEQSALALTIQRDATRRGQLLRFVVAVIALFLAVFCAVIGQAWLGAVFLAVPVMGVATSLVNSARKLISGPQSGELAQTPLPLTSASSPSTGGSPDEPASH